MFRSIRWRIALPYVLLILILMAGMGVYFARFLEDSYLNVLESELTAQARMASAALAPGLKGEAGPDQVNALARLWADVLQKRVTIIAVDGTVIGESQIDRSAMENHAGRPEIIEARFTGQGVAIRFSDTLQTEMMYAAVPIPSEGTMIGFARVAMPLAIIQDRIRHFESTLLAVTLIASMLSVALAFWIASRATRPVRQLAEVAGRIAGSSHVSRPQESHLIPTTQDEIGLLTLKFNEMTTQLGAQISALDAERSRMAAVLEEMTDGVLIIDTGGKVQLVNSAAERMFEIRSSDVVGRSLIEVLRHHEIQELWQACIHRSETTTGTIETAGRRLYLQCTATPLGRALQGSSLLIFQNLTRLRRLETIRQDFVSNISHELRTPLASLKALTETLQEGALDDPPAARSFLARIETEVDALGQMVEELLELTRIESGRVPLKLGPISARQLLDSAVERLNVQAERAGLEIAVICADDLPPVLADAHRLEHVVVNLLHNAIKFTPAGGRVVLSARQDAKKVIFEVRDTGIGIPSEDLLRIFERFFKSDRARASGGTGLGLAIARHLVEAHGGRIWVESVEGKGSSFYFSIPTTG